MCEMTLGMSCEGTAADTSVSLVRQQQDDPVVADRRL